MHPWTVNSGSGQLRLDSPFLQLEERERHSLVVSRVYLHATLLD